jgi:Trk K+ transport system NAD-binding subunit
VKQTNHILVVGIGSVGLQVIENLLMRGERVVAVDKQAAGKYLPAVHAMGIPVVIGDAMYERALRDAGMATAKALVSVSSDDLTNLEIGLNARLLNPDVRVVLRIYDPVLAQSLDEDLDMHFAFSMSSIAASALAELAEKKA